MASVYFLQPRASTNVSRLRGLVHAKLFRRALHFLLENPYELEGVWHNFPCLEWHMEFSASTKYSDDSR